MKIYIRRQNVFQNTFIFVMNIAQVLMICVVSLCIYCHKKSTQFVYMNHKNLSKYEIKLKIWTMRNTKVTYSKSLLFNIGCNIE